MTAASSLGTVSPPAVLPVGGTTLAAASNILFDVARAAASIDGALGATVRGLSETLVAALGSPNDRVGTARLDTAMVDFAREAKALVVGNPDANRASVNAIIDEAIAFGAAKSAALPDVGLRALDHATTLFAEAACALSVALSSPLYDPGAR